MVFLLNSPGKVSTPMAATPSAPVEISDNFNTRYLLGRACRDVLQHGQVCCWHHAQTLYCVVSLLELYTQLCLQAVFLFTAKTSVILAKYFATTIVRDYPSLHELIHAVGADIE